MGVDSQRQGRACGHIEKLRARQLAAVDVIANKKLLITKLKKEIAHHACPPAKGYPIPNVAVDTFGAFDYRKFVELVLGLRLPEGYNVTSTKKYIDIAVASLRPMGRFVIEARMRGVTFRRITEMVGWKSKNRVQQVANQALRMLRHPSRARPINDLLKEQGIKSE